MKKSVVCPHCGKNYSCFRNPVPTTDVVIYDPKLGVVLIKRNNAPLGYALPGGFVDEGEQVEAAAKREMLEETGLEVDLLGVLGVYSSPGRDPRQHTLSVVFAGSATHPEQLRAGDDAGEAGFYQFDNLPKPLVFDHAQILADFQDYLLGKRQLASIEPLPRQD